MNARLPGMVYHNLFRPIRIEDAIEKGDRLLEEGGAVIDAYTGPSFDEYEEAKTGHERLKASNAKLKADLVRLNKAAPVQ